MRTAYARRQRGPERWEREAEARAQHAEREADERARREERLLPKVDDSTGASGAWERTQALVSEQVPESTYRIWLEPLRCLGEAEGALCLVAPDEIRTWVERRYARLLGDAVREASSYRGVFLLCDVESGSSDGCF